MKLIIAFVKSHKFFIGILLTFIIAGSTFATYHNNKNQDRDPVYKTEKVSKGLLLSTVSGTGQVSASNQVELKPKSSGELTALYIQNGETVKKGQLLAQIDSRSAARKYNEAKNNLEATELEYEEFLQPSDEYTILQAKNSLEDAKDQITKLQTSQEDNLESAIDNLAQYNQDLKEGYEDSYNSLIDAYLDLPELMTDLNDTLNGKSIASSLPATQNQINVDSLLNSVLDKHYSEKTTLENYIDSSESYYTSADTIYQQAISEYQNLSRTYTTEEINNLLDKTITLAKAISDSAKSSLNMIDYWIDYRVSHDFQSSNSVTSAQNSLSSALSSANSQVTALLKQQKSLEQTKQNIAETEKSIKKMEIENPLEIESQERTIQEKEKHLEDLQSGPTELEMKNKQISLQQKKNSLLEAEQTLADYSVRAPFAGQIAELNVAKGDTIGSSTTLATLITEQKIAEITLNEIDAAKVTVGQNVNIQFDALDDLVISGEVIEVDTLGEVTQGVVSYGIKLGFDIQDERVKPGMSISADIVVAMKPEALLVPLSAIKESGEVTTYVEKLNNDQVEKVSIIPGISNDIYMEVLSGLNENEEIITQTITVNNNITTTTQTTQKSSQNQNFGSMRMMIR